MGISLSSIFLCTPTLDRAVFFITAATSAPSLYGYTTKRDMSGRIVPVMGLIGIIIASVVNLSSPARCCVHRVGVGVLVFAASTAWDTQRLKNDYIYGYASAGRDVRSAPPLPVRCRCT